MYTPRDAKSTVLMRSLELPRMLYESPKRTPSAFRGLQALNEYLVMYANTYVQKTNYNYRYYINLLAIALL